MKSNTFGEYLKELRIGHMPALSQEALGDAIGRSKMTISQYENGKGRAPQGKILEDIISALDSTPEQAEHLRFLSARENHSIPDDIFEYFYTDSSLYTAIRKTQEAGEGKRGLANRLINMEGNDADE